MTAEEAGTGSVTDPLKKEGAMSHGRQGSLCIYQELYLPTILMMAMNCSPEDPKGAGPWLNCDFNQ